MREPLEVLTCDTTGCDAQVTARRSQLSSEARAAGWQVRAVTQIAITEDDGYVREEDHCPQHPVDVVEDDTVAGRSG